MIAFLFGVLISVAPAIAVVAGVCVVGLLLLSTRAWIGLAWATLVGLVLLSYGFNNIPVPLGALRVPAVDIILFYALVASAPHWGPVLRTQLGQLLFASLLSLTVVAAARLAVDVPKYGIVAGRDALYVLEAWGVMVGVALGRLWGPERLYRWLGVLWKAAMLWLVLFPFRELLANFGPIVGIQRPTPLITFTSAAFVASTSLFWFGQHRRSTSLLFAGLALVVLVMTLSRGQYLAVILTLAVGWFIHMIRNRRNASGSATRLARRFVVAVALGFLFLAVIPPLPGRLGEQVGMAAVGTQMMTLFGGEGPGAGSLRHREEAWPEVVRTVKRKPGGWLTGVGYGPDLFGSFRVADGVEVRKPHNDPLEVWARSGLAGLIPWLMFLATLGWWAFRMAPHHAHGWWLVALQMAILMASLTQPAFGFAYLGLTYTLLMGMAIGSSLKLHLSNG